ncbi:MAG: hypothetical protein A3E82_02920 [Gammaproteobacteria bacterium RIFCSPHIGHO2_12_FULL_38_11]|nr:MAG: hypothetical protein A3E82_02920 [Gammaproteobacteria bacterium RIFCSPHIGHO2_12_FULL_38_11]
MSLFNIYQKSANSTLHFIFEVTIAFFISLFIFLVGYFFFLENSFNNYYSAKREQKKAISENNQKKILRNADDRTKKLLSTWAIKNTDFYHAMQASETPDQLLQLLTISAQQSGFTIIQAAPVVSSQNNFQVKLSGNYTDLFHLIDELNNTAWPFLLEKLSIKNKNQYALLLKVNNQ